jgi:hypothetical protein
LSKVTKDLWSPKAQSPLPPETEPVQVQVETGARAKLKQPDFSDTRGRHHIEQPGQQGDRPTYLVGLRRNLQGGPQFRRVPRDHRPQHWPGERGIGTTT